MTKIIEPFHLGQQVKILPVKQEYCHPPRYYKPSVGIIVELGRGNPYEYSICPKTNKDKNSGAWFPHSCMKLMLNGKVTQSNLKKALDYLNQEE